jgi:phosphatidate cytidylyltransferase
VAFTSGADADGEDAGDTDVVIDVTDDSVDSPATPVEAGTIEGTGDAPTDAVAELADEAGDDEPHEDTIEFFLDGSDDDAEAATEEGESEESILVDESDDHPAIEDADDATEPAPGSNAVDSPNAEPGDASEVASDAPAEDADLADTGSEHSNDGLQAAAAVGSVDPTDTTDRDQLMVLPVVPIDAAPASEDAIDIPEPGSESDDEDSDDDTGEIPIIGVAAAAGREIDDGSSVFDFNELADEHYVQTATRDHQDLAAAIDQADSEDTQQVAISAAIPGLESGVVGFDDVVAAGDDSAPATQRKVSSLLPRVGTGIALVATFLLSLLWRPAITVLALAAFIVAAGEFYSVLMHRRYKPMSIFGFIGILAAGLGTIVWGVIAIPITFALMATVILLYGAVSQRRIGAVSGFALTLLVAWWAGGFGSFAFPIIAAEEYQVLVLTVVAMVALVDISAYFVGSSIGRRPFAPNISPKKTIEGFVGGTFMAFLAGAGASFFVESIDLPTGLVLGAAVAIFAPLGDLAVSVVKRSLDIKDMGSILPGHGGLLDRIDAIIAVVPAAWAVFAWAGLL